MKRYFIPRFCEGGQTPQIFAWYNSPGLGPIWRSFSNPTKAQYSQPQRARSLMRNPSLGWVGTLPVENTSLSNPLSWVELKSYGLQSVTNTLGSLPAGRVDVVEVTNPAYLATRLPRVVKTNHKIGVPKGHLP